MSDNFQTTRALDDLVAAAGTEIGVSRWFAMPQSRVDGFADVTEDWYFIHTNPARAADETPWGGTIAHGFLTLSLLSAMAYEVCPQVEGASRGVNYGFDRIRFVSPVPVGSRVRGRFVLERADTSRANEVTLTYGVTVEIEDAERPALAAQWLTRQFWD
ncbi:MAG: MaoC family dehydratase [Pseudomonadota bacterium]